MEKAERETVHTWIPTQLCWVHTACIVLIDSLEATLTSAATGNILPSEHPPTL